MFYCCSGTLVSIKVVALCQVWLVLGWVTVGVSVNTFVCNQSPRSTQPGHPSVCRYMSTTERWAVKSKLKLKTNLYSAIKSRVTEPMTEYLDNCRGAMKQKVYRRLHNTVKELWQFVPHTVGSNAECATVMSGPSTWDLQ